MKILLKKITSSIVIASTLLSSMSVFADFIDMPEEPVLRQALENAVENGLLTGYDTNEIKPYESITRAQMAAIMVRALGAEEKADISAFKDMNQSQWYYDSMSKAVAMGAFKGDGENLNPENNITFQEAFTVLTRIFDLVSQRDLDNYKLKAKLIKELPAYDTDVLDNYADKDSIASWAESSVRAIVENGYWVGENNLLRPTEYINRGEFATVMDNLIGVYINEPGTYNNFQDENIMIRTNDVVINGVNGEIDIFTGDSVKEGIVVDNSVFNRVVMRGGNLLLKENSECDIVRMIGHNCLFDYSERPKVNIIISAVYDDSRVNLGIKEIK